MTSVFTARIDTRDLDALNVTRKSAGPDGLPFAPSWPLLQSGLAGMRAAVENWQCAQTMEGRRIAGGDYFAIYDRAYREEMRQSYVEHRAVWDALLARTRVVLTCYCVDHLLCHRSLLAHDILPALGAVYGGELSRPKAQGDLFGKEPGP